MIDEALRGGTSARELEERTLQRLHQAEKAVEEAAITAPSYLVETAARHKTLLESAASLNTELEMLGESLDDITDRSHQMLQRAQADARHKEALDELALAIIPFVAVADALANSDRIPDSSFAQLQTTIDVLTDAITTAVESRVPQLSRMVSELEQRADEATAMIKARYMDTFEIHPNRIIAKGASHISPDVPVGAASAALAKAGLLENAISAIIAELLRNDVAKGLAKATLFFYTTAETPTLEWSMSVDNDAELLEFDFDDIEALSDDDIDAMTDHLDISNSAARALKVYDILRDKVVGEDYSRQLAFAMQPWFNDHILNSSVVMSSHRDQYAATGVPRDVLRSRVKAVSACAKVIQMAMRARGASSFVLIVEMDSLESKVGSECRGQAVLTARRAIGSFSNAWHDNNEMMACPLAAKTYIALSKRPPEYFAPCLVTRTAIIVHETFLSTRQDAVEALQGGSSGIGNALNAAALECLRAYREDVPVQHASELRASLRLKALYYNDCMMFAHSCRISAAKFGQTSEMEEEINFLEAAANKAMMVVRRTAEQRLVENLNAACRNGALGAYGTLTRIHRGSALSAAFNAMREVVKVFADIVPTELAELAAGRLLDKYLRMLCNEVVKLPEISTDGCEQIDMILKAADKNVSTLMKLVEGMEVVRGGGSPPEVITQMRVSQKRLQAICEILNARMEDIVNGYRSGKYSGLVDRQEIEHFLRAVFEDTNLRATFIADLDMSLEEENGEWQNSNW